MHGDRGNPSFPLQLAGQARRLIEALRGGLPGSFVAPLCSEAGCAGLLGTVMSLGALDEATCDECAGG